MSLRVEHDSLVRGAAPAGLMHAFRRESRKLHLRWKMKAALGGKGFSFISSNCVGGRFSEILGEQYRSPTVGLWFAPADYLRFVENLSSNLARDIECDEAASRRQGCPAGRVNDIRITFLHYPDFDTARRKWNARKARVDRDKLVLIASDRDGMTYEQMRQFDALPVRRKILFTHEPHGELASACFVTEGNETDQVGELYSFWHLMDAALPFEYLKALAA